MWQSTGDQGSNPTRQSFRKEMASQNQVQITYSLLHTNAFPLQCDTMQLISVRRGYIQCPVTPFRPSRKSEWSRKKFSMWNFMEMRDVIHIQLEIRPVIASFRIAMENNL